VLTAAGAGRGRRAAPRVNDKRVDEAGERRRFSSVILPAWCRKSPKITEVLPLLYLHGLSSQDFAAALEGFLGTGFGAVRGGDHPVDRAVAGRGPPVR
jgi:putative transposase